MSRKLSTLQGQGGRELPTNIRASMETRLGADLSHVRIHDGGFAHEMSRSLGAPAFSLGNHLVFERGQFQPNNPRGLLLLAHEIAHTLQPGGALIARRAPPPDGETDYGPKLMHRLLQFVHKGYHEKVTRAELSRLTDDNLKTILSVVMPMAKERQGQSGQAANEFSKNYLGGKLAEMMGLIERILGILNIRVGIAESNNFAVNAKEVRESGLSGDAKCFFDVALPRIPKYLKAMLNGFEPAPTHDDKVQSGYLPEKAVTRLLADGGSVSAQNIVKEMEVVPLRLARVFFASGSDIAAIAKAVVREELLMNEGLAKISNLTNTLGVGDGSSPIEHLMGGLLTLQRTPGTLYSCTPAGGTVVAGQGHFARKRTEALHTVLAENSNNALASLPSELVPYVDVHEIAPSKDKDKVFERFVDAPTLEFAEPGTWVEEMAKLYK